jgi:hypothetical protein
MAGDLTLYHPGDQPGVLVEANTNGDVAQRGDGVAIVGADAENVHVALTAGAGEGIGTLAREPERYDDTASYAAGDEVGLSEVLLRHFVDWHKTTDSYTPSAGDEVVFDTDGEIRSVDQDGTAPDDNDRHVIGPVWKTSGPEGTLGKAAVVKQR